VNHGFIGAILLRDSVRFGAAAPVGGYLKGESYASPVTLLENRAKVNVTVGTVLEPHEDNLSAPAQLFARAEP
jgi:hypothetical protein